MINGHTSYLLFPNTLSWIKILGAGESLSTLKSGIVSNKHKRSLTAVIFYKHFTAFCSVHCSKGKSQIFNIVDLTLLLEAWLCNCMCSNKLSKIHSFFLWFVTRWNSENFEICSIENSFYLTLCKVINGMGISTKQWL